jgi:hypothetical protein
MSTNAREAVWLLLSDLFVDTEHTDQHLYAIGQSLKKTGFSVDEVETILHREVAPVCGRWMLYPGAIGPWPMFDEEDLKHRIKERLSKPWYKRPLVSAGLWLMPSIKREWGVIQNAMRG